jgi:hypothetical protein
MHTRQVTVSIEEEVLARVLRRCPEHELGRFLTEAAAQRCTQDDSAAALDAYLMDFGQPWSTAGGWPTPDSRTI